MGNLWGKQELVHQLEDIKQKSWKKRKTVRRLQRSTQWLSNWKRTAAVLCLATCVVTLAFNPFGWSWTIIAILLVLFVFLIVWLALPALLRCILEAQKKQLDGLNEERKKVLEKVKTTKVYEEAQQLLSVYDGDAFDVSIQL